MYKRQGRIRAKQELSREKKGKEPEGFYRRRQEEDVLDLIDQIERGFDDIEHRIALSLIHICPRETEKLTKTDRQQECICTDKCGKQGNESCPLCSLWPERCRAKRCV